MQKNNPKGINNMFIYKMAHFKIGNLFLDDLNSRNGQDYRFGYV